MAIETDKQIGWKPPKGMRAQVERAAAEEGLPLSTLITRAVRLYLKGGPDAYLAAARERIASEAPRDEVEADLLYGFRMIREKDAQLAGAALRLIGLAVRSGACATLLCALDDLRRDPGFHSGDDQPPSGMRSRRG